ncbi:monocarboxylate transporter 14-like [Mytilus edulis]
MTLSVNMGGSKFDDISEKDVEIEPEPEPRNSRCPDGGWGWVIVLAAFCANVVVDGICFTAGMYHKEWMSFFNVHHVSVSMVTSLLVGCYLLAGPVAGVLANRFGCRKVVMGGTLISVIGLLISTVSPNVEVLIITFGIITGIGFGLIYLPSIVIIGYWFEKKRAFATGMALCGSGIGTLLFSSFNKYIFDEYDIKNGTVILAGVVLQCAVCGACYRPLYKAKRTPRMKRGIVQQGLIMKALIAEKERQRTISNGSLDNCIITRDNRLIKIDKIEIDKMNKSNSYINRLKEHLGFSSRSLNKIIPGIVRDKFIFDSKPQTPVQEKKEFPRRKRDYERRRDSGCGSLCDSPQSGNNLPQEDPWEKLCRDDSVKFPNEKDIKENGSLLVPVKRNGSFGPQDSFRPLDSNHLTPPTTIIGTSLMSAMTGSEYDASVRTLMMEYEHPIPEWIRSISHMLDLSLLKDKTFILYASASFLNMLGFFIPFFFLQDLIESLNLMDHKDPVPIVFSVIGLSNAIGRVLAGWIADRPWANVVFLNNASLVLAGVMTIIWPFCTSVTHLSLVAVGFGSCTAAFLALRSIVVVELFGLHRLTSTFGLLILFQGVASVIGSPLAGWIIDSTGSVNAVYYMAGACLATAGVLGCPLRRKNNNNDVEIQNSCYTSQHLDIETVKIETKM